MTAEEIEQELDEIEEQLEDLADEQECWELHKARLQKELRKMHEESK